MTDLLKMSKKKKKAYYAKQRIFVPFNTGTRTLKSAKYPSRNKLNEDTKKLCE